MAGGMARANNNPKTYPICGATNKSGFPCGNLAGKRTQHKRMGRCWLHGGNNQQPTAKSFKHGLYSQVGYPGIQEEIARLEKDRDVFDLRDHIFLMEAICNTILKDAKTSEDLFPIVKVIGEITRVVERLHAIEVGRRYVISIENLDSIIGRIVDSVKRYVNDPYIIDLIAEDIQTTPVITVPRLEEHSTTVESEPS